MVNSVDPDHTAPIAVCFGSTLFASILNSSAILGNYLQQMTSADNIFKCIFSWRFKGSGWPYDRYVEDLRLKEKHKEFTFHDNLCYTERYGIVSYWHFFYGRSVENLWLKENTRIFISYTTQQHSFALYRSPRHHNLEKTTNSTHLLTNFTFSSLIKPLSDVNCYCKMVSLVALDGVTSFLRLKDVTYSCERV